MGLRGRLERAEKAAEGRTTVLRCPVCGVVVRVPGDAALMLLVEDWRREAGQPFDPDPDLEPIRAHPHPELRREAFRDVPGVPAPEYPSA